MNTIGFMLRWSFGAARITARSMLRRASLPYTAAALLLVGAPFALLAGDAPMPVGGPGGRTNQIGTPLRMRTNSLPGAAKSPGQTNRPATFPANRPAPPTAAPATPTTPAPKATPGKTNTVAGTAAAGTNAAPGLAGTIKKWSESRAFYPVIGGVIACVIVLLAFVMRSKPKVTAASPDAVAAGKVAPRPAAARKVSKVSKVTVSSCNVLEVGPEARNVWQFEAKGSGFALTRQQTSLVGEPLPGSIVGKSWRTLFQRKLNVAWLPPEQVFLRVTQIPRSDVNETLSMVELQLEKLSPMPVTQVAWSFHVLPHATGNMQTVIVMLVARNVVEEFLGKLESEGYLADRLELPVLDQLQATAITEDGAWIYPDPASGSKAALVAWWYGGVLQNLDLLLLPPPANRANDLKEQLNQMAWAGELEGWLTAPPEWHLVADVGAQEWETALKAGLELPIEVITPIPPAQIASATARRAALGDARVNLLPPEYSARYQQEFVDRLWMRGLVTLGGVYVAVVAIYLIASSIFSYRAGLVEEKVKSLGGAYTNAMQLEARYQILKDRQDLKFAGLDCWNKTAELLPENATLDRLNFNEGKRLVLNGTAPSDQMQRMLDFEAAMRKATVNGQPLFNPTAGDNITFRNMGPNMSWGFSLELKRSDSQ